MVEKEQLIREVTSLKQGNGLSEEFTALLRDDLYYYILKLVKDHHLAEDLTQDTFLAIYEKCDELQEPVALISWSKKIAYRKSTDYFKVRHDVLVDEFEEGHSIFDTLEENRGEFLPDAALHQKELKEEIHAMIMELPEDQRSAILLRYFDEMSLKEIAAIHEVPEGTIKSRLNTARNALKQTVKKYEKKNGVKLHCVGVIPLLLWLFRQYRLEADVPLTKPNVSGQFFGETARRGAAAAMAAGGSAASASATATAAGSGVAGFLSVRMAVGIALGILAIGVGFLTPVMTEKPAIPETTAPVICPLESSSAEAGETEIAETTEENETPAMPVNTAEPSETAEPTAEPTYPETTVPEETDPVPTQPENPDPVEPSEPAPTQPSEPAPTESTDPEETTTPGEDETPEMPFPQDPEDPEEP